jgi:hypothetical protein
MNMLPTVLLLLPTVSVYKELIPHQPLPPKPARKLLTMLRSRPGTVVDGEKLYVPHDGSSIVVAYN